MIRYIGERYYNLQNSVKEDPYSLINIAVGYAKNDWEVELYANNLFDKEYVDFMVYTPSNNFYHFGPSRVIGVTLSKAF
jgi:outer membrane receptor protein involved in Fe transport